MNTDSAHFWLDAPAGALALSEGARRAAGSRTARMFSSRLPVSERHVQAIWYDPAWRPQELRTSAGETVRVIDPGAWNVESGPDFKNAILETGGRRVRGDVEIHLRPADWQAHGHGADPAYARVAAHVTWLSGTPPADLPAGAVSISLESSFAADPSFSAAAIDVSAYPYAHFPPSPRPCAAVLGRDPDLAVAMLRAAGERRIGVKAAAFARALAAAGDPRQTLWEETLAALGYKNNTANFRELARAAPLRELSANREDALAALLGAARILPDFDRTQDAAAAEFARSLAGRWFENPGARVDPEFRPRTAGLRPANSPVRRLAAAAALACAPGGLTPPAGDCGPGALRSFTRALCEAARWPFFETHWGFSSRAASPGESGRPPSLLGPARAAAMVANVFVPFAIAQGALPAAPEWLPPEDLSLPMRQTANRLLGRDHNPALYSSNGLLMQGLLQTRRDFCLSVHPDCSACPLAAALVGDSAERSASAGERAPL